MPAMGPFVDLAAASPLRLARQAWADLHADSQQALKRAQAALQLAQTHRHARAEGWARLTIGFHLVYFATLRDAEPELTRARQILATEGDRAGAVLAGAGLARALWRAGRFGEAVDQVVPLRDEGLRVLTHEQRSVLLNIIAGCHSAAGQSEQAFAYLYQALRDVRPSRARGYDAVLHCNLAHELLLLGDCHEALRHIDQGLERCAQIDNPRLRSVLLINRIICLTDLGRPQDARADVQRVRDLPADARGRGLMAAHYETLAIAALQAGDVVLGEDLVTRALATPRSPIPDEHLELAVAQGLLAGRRGEVAHGLRTLRAAKDWAADAADAGNRGASLRVRCLYWQTVADLQEQTGHFGEALESLRHWQQLHVEQADLASRARYQAAALQTELLRLQHKLDENDARRRATERARAALEAANAALARKMEEVQSLQAALREQATRDELTGLFNRRHLNAVLPSLLAMAQREQAPLAAVMIDLDHFKQVNDRLGHNVGDRLLAAFGKLLSEGGRQGDVACRWGGEEFCLLMPNTPAAGARRKVQALLRRWRAEAFDVATGHVLAGLSFSAGTSDTTISGHEAEALLKDADAELLLAKQSGRNCVRARAPSTADGRRLRA
jgi:diguanylate cyclase (GGDEF)-like protein